MKTLLTACFALAGLSSIAQFKTPGSKFNFNYNYLNKPNPSAIKFSVYPKATLINQTTNGSVYSLPADGTPCFVPDIKEVIAMPNQKNYFNNSLMLNPYRSEELIPKQ